MATHLCIPGEEANGILSRFASAQSAQAHALQLAEYRELLASMDWHFEFADDYSVVRRGREQIQRIRALQPYVDADAALFNAARPDQLGVPTL
mgnify:CR=1 FL=1